MTSMSVQELALLGASFIAFEVSVLGDTGTVPSDKFFSVFAPASHIPISGISHYCSSVLNDESRLVIPFYYLR